MGFPVPGISRGSSERGSSTGSKVPWETVTEFQANVPASAPVPPTWCGGGVTETKAGTSAAELPGWG
jgi:hypothetical protein